MPNPKTETATDQWAETELTELLAEYYRLAEPEMERGGDFLWQLSERFECGKPLGWFVEHDGEICQLDFLTGEDGARDHAKLPTSDHRNSPGMRRTNTAPTA
jgi:hypothetical protein